MEGAPELPDLDRILAGLPDDDLLAALDAVLLELEKRLLQYARGGPEILQMADEGLVLAARSAARRRCSSHPSRSRCRSPSWRSPDCSSRARPRAAPRSRPPPSSACSSRRSAGT